MIIMVNDMKITILGAGAYALGLAYRLNGKNQITIWSKVFDEIDTLLKTKKNNKALKGIQMPDGISYSKDLKESIKKSKIIIIAVATKYIPATCMELRNYFTKDQHVVIASKGIEEKSCKFASELVSNILNTTKICTISGPSFAKDMASNNAIGLSLAATNRNTRKIVKESFSTNNLKIRTTKDFVGVELCGTMKNVIAVTSGILDGLGLSESTKAMFLTESLNDIRILIKKMGGNDKTILSFAGFGDIILTCTSPSSRNYTYGKMLGSNKSQQELNDYLENYTVEGIYTLKSVYKMIKSKRIKYPFLDLIYKISFGLEDPKTIINFLINKE